MVADWSAVAFQLSAPNTDPISHFITDRQTDRQTTILCAAVSSMIGYKWNWLGHKLRINDDSIATQAL